MPIPTVQLFMSLILAAAPADLAANSGSEANASPDPVDEVVRVDDSSSSLSADLEEFDLPDARAPLTYVEIGALWLDRNNARTIQIGEVTSAGVTTETATTDAVGYEMSPSLMLLVGCRLDPNRSVEFSYYGLHTSVGLAELTTTSVTAPITSQFFEFGIIPGGAGATAAPSYSYTSSLNNVELNGRRRFGWGDERILSCLAGIRYLSIREKIELSQEFTPPMNDPTTTGERTVSHTQNNLIGVHVGAQLDDYFGPLLVSTRAGAGLFANIAGQDTSNVTLGNGRVTFRNDADDTDIAGIFELGFSARFIVLRHFAIQIGYQAMFITNVALAPEQLPANITQVLSTLTPLSPTIVEDAFVVYHGPSLFAHFRW